MLLFCDFHAHSRNENIFMYGCDTKYSVLEKVFPYLLANRSPQFSWPVA